MNRFIKKCIRLFFAPLLLAYLKRDRYYRYQGVKILVKRGVFHPGFFFSTKFLIKAINTFDIKNKTQLELGAGSGLISFISEKNGAIVTATDVNPIAINGLVHNKNHLNSNIEIRQSDLFDLIPNQIFDFVIINPPYYPKNPKSDAEKAWYCGEDFEYFKKLFKQLPNYINSKSTVLISFSEDCKLSYIESIANENNLRFVLFERRRIMWEENYIYKIIK
jgi:release factor glutamine methyltransferase